MRRSMPAQSNLAAMVSPIPHTSSTMPRALLFEPEPVDVWQHHSFGISRLISDPETSAFAVVNPSPVEQSAANAIRLSRRIRDVLMAQNTPGYALYLSAVPRALRRPRCEVHPPTPTPEDAITFPKRRWDGLIRDYKRRLHLWDDGGDDDELVALWNSTSW